MNTYVALLRGINVGGKHTISMTELKHLFEELGFSNVKTYINSGNVVFEGKNPDAEKISTVIEKTFGFPVPIVVLSANDFKKIAQKIPHKWQNNTEQKTDILFLWPDFDNNAVLASEPFVEGVDELLYISDALIWHILKKQQNKSYMQKGFIGSNLYKNMTARNVNTVRKLVDLLDK